MNTEFSGCQIIKLLHEGRKTVIYRGLREAEPTSVIIKTLKAEYPTIEEITRLKHEYQILQTLDIPGIVKPYELTDYQHGLALILEDFAGESLKQFIDAQKISLINFLEIGIFLAQTLGELHRTQIIHKDIKPQNILINSETGEVKLIDFSIATRLEKESPGISSPNLLEGTLAYMSPEQTGRMNRFIDYRTDFYSLGVTFYEILAGQLPFQNFTDPMELVHCHIAKSPVPLSKINSEIPDSISSIVMKLLAKNAEERYQSALGIKADLEECLRQLQSSHQIGKFVLGKLDKSGQFVIPQKLYGREAEVAELMAAFERISLGTSEIMLVSGYSGIGKTCLINEIHKPIVRQRGHFIAGKFDQFKRNIPYAALIQAFSELIRQLLTENSEKIEFWKQEIETALEQNGKVITDVISEVELIVGSQPEVPQLGSTEAQNRFNRVFKQFIHIFAKPEHPLVIFLDDLQWADSASLKLIQLLTTDPDSKYLLLIGAYRDNEVSPTHPTILVLEEIKKAGAVIKNIVLRPLDISNVSQLVADTLNETERSKLLSELLFNKTQGNPFFLTQLFKTLNFENLLNFDFFEGRWLWDIEQIQALGIIDYNVVDLVARNILKLPEKTQQVLKLAACIGDRFNLEVIAIVNEKSLLASADDLWPALQAGLILPLNNNYKIPLVFDSEKQDSFNFDNSTITYKFLHDRVQQAAYSLIPQEDKKITHLKIGQLLLKKTSQYALEENIFDIVNQLNIGVELITEQAEREKLANLNLQAGKKAKSATAYEAASKYLTIGIELLPQQSWHNYYQLTWNLYVEALETAYLNIDFEKGKYLSEIILQESRTLLEKIKVYELKIPFYCSQDQMQQALSTGIEVLEMLGVSLPKKPNKLLVVRELIRKNWMMRNKRIEDLANLPAMTDPYKLASMRILMNIIPATFNANPIMFPLCIFKMMKLCLKYGNSPLAPYAYVSYSMIACGVLGEINSGYKFGNLALELLGRSNSKELNSKVHLCFYNFVKHWKDPLKEARSSFIEAYQIGVENGDIEYACYNIFALALNLFWSGESLEYINKAQNQYWNAAQKYKQELTASLINTWEQITHNILNYSENKCDLKYNGFDEEKVLLVLKKKNNQVGIASIYLIKLILNYLFKNHQYAVENAKLVEEYQAGLSGTILSAGYIFYYSLALLAHYSSVEKKQQKKYLNQVVSHQKQMQKWATHAACNFQHKYDLVEAEKGRVLKQDAKAIDFYDRAIQGAKINGYIQEEALANELAAEFYLSRGRDKIAKTYMTEAYYCYIRWGAKAKVRDLDERYPNLISRTIIQESENINITRTTSTSTSTSSKESQILDLTTVIKASLALSGEILIGNLLDKLLKISIENAGAQKGLFISKSDNKWIVEAEATVEENEVKVSHTATSAGSVNLPISLLNYVERTRKSSVLDNAKEVEIFANDPYILANQTKSVLCSPIIHQGKLTGILYLENNLIIGAFTSDRLNILNLLTSQISISIENARLYTNLQSYSQRLENKSQELEAKSQELEIKNAALQASELREREKAEALERSLHELQQTQAQLVQTEKISSLGQLVAGVAHEVNNPVSFISGNLHYATQYVEDLLGLVQLYQQHYPEPNPEIAEEIEAIELDYLVEDLPKMLSSMNLGTERIREIMQSLRNFSRVDDAQAKPADIHAGLDSTLMILHHRLKANAVRPAVELIKEYGQLPLVECYPGQLNQVFMNLIANAIDAFDEFNRGKTFAEIERQPNMIRIRTEVSQGASNDHSTGSRAIIRIADNGHGMSADTLSKLFQPFFTTKPVGKGTGLGLSISYKIVVEKHHGSLRCTSTPGEGTEFIIEIPILQSQEVSEVAVEN